MAFEMRKKRSWERKAQKRETHRDERNRRSVLI
jgi:hypothetical protein